jgi:hypothetical protein
MYYPSADGNIPICMDIQICRTPRESFTVLYVSEPNVFHLADNRKGDPASMGPLDFYNLIFVGSNRRIKLWFDSSPIKLH